MRKKLNDNEKKARVTISLNKQVAEILNTNYNNVSKHVEWLIYQDLKKNNIIDKDIML